MKRSEAVAWGCSVIRTLPNIYDIILLYYCVIVIVFSAVDIVFLKIAKSNKCYSKKENIYFFAEICENS